MIKPRVKTFNPNFTFKLSFFFFFFEKTVEVAVLPLSSSFQIPRVCPKLLTTLADTEARLRCPGGRVIIAGQVEVIRRVVSGKTLISSVLLLSEDKCLWTLLPGMPPKYSNKSEKSCWHMLVPF